MTTQLLPLSREEIMQLEDGTKLQVKFQDNALFTVRTNKALIQITDAGIVSLKNKVFNHACFYVIIGQNHVGANMVRYIPWDSLKSDLSVFLVDSKKEDFKSMCERIKNKYRKNNE